MAADSTCSTRMRYRSLESARATRYPGSNTWKCACGGYHNGRNPPPGADIVITGKPMAPRSQSVRDLIRGNQADVIVTARKAKP